MLEECPFCNKFFAAEQISKEPVDSNTESVLGEPPTVSSGHYTPLWQPKPVEIFTTYKILYRCRHCGKEWSKVSEKESDIPRREAGAEQASSEEVEREEGEAKENEYVREDTA